jgi:hypothetical protein
MPEPRLLLMGGEILLGYDDGRSDAFRKYGHKPWQKGYKDPQRDKRETASLDRFQAEYAMMKGTRFTARDFEFGGRSLVTDTEEGMKHHRQIFKRYSNRR